MCISGPAWTNPLRREKVLLSSIESSGASGKHRHKVFLEFFQDELSSLPVVFSSCAHSPYTHLDTRRVSISCYGYEA